MVVTRDNTTNAWSKVIIIIGISTDIEAGGIGKIPNKVLGFPGGIPLRL